MNAQIPLYKPRDSKPYALTHKSLDLYIDCAKCFFLQHRVGKPRPKTEESPLESATLLLLQREVEGYRKMEVLPPIVAQAGIAATLFKSPDLNRWTTSGIEYHDRWTNFVLSSPVQDVWINGEGELNLVGHLAMVEPGETGKFDHVWQLPLKRRIELAMWCLRQQEIKVAGSSYWLIANADTERERLDGSLNFKMSVVTYKARDGWVRSMLAAVKDCLERDGMPAPSAHCEYCARE